MTPATHIFQWAEWTFEPAEWRLSYSSSVPVSLPNKTLALLALLLERAPGLVSKDEILSTVWGEAVVEEGNIAFHIAALRKTLDAAGTPSCIETVRGRGYRFVAPVTRRRVWKEEPPLLTPIPPLTLTSVRPHAEEPATVAAAAAGMPVPAEPDSPAAPPPLPAAVAAPLPRTSRFWTRAVPVLVLAALIGGIGWATLANLDARIRAVTVMPARAADGAPVDGVAEAMIAQLSRQTDIAVGGAAWAGPTETAIDAGLRLKAEAVLIARVDKSREPWRVEVELTRMRDRQRLWFWIFELPSSIPAPAATIGARAAEGLGRHVGAMVRLAPGGVHPDAYALVVQGREQWRLRTPPAVKQAIDLYERAIALEPSYARAYVGLADCYNLTMSGLPPGIRYERAKAAVERALALDPDLAEAHTSLGFLRYKFEWRWKDAEASFRRAIEIDPSYALAHHWYGEMLGYMGRSEEAIVELRRAMALDPNSIAAESDLVPVLIRLDRTADARVIVESAAARNATWHWVPRRMSEVLAAEGRERESLEEHWRALVLTGASLESIEELRAAYRAGGLPAVLRVDIRRLLEKEAATPGAWMVASDLSRAYARLGDRASALKWLAIALDRREDAAILMATHPDYESLRREPEFVRLLDRVGIRHP